jgi:phosphatidylserine/phosphatidylglycerophosphate/cardiolipin synthase-like enzyme
MTSFHNSLLFCLLLLLLLLFSLIYSTNQYVNQTRTYTSQFVPLTVSYGESLPNSKVLNVTGFFSPDHSISTLTSLVQNARFEILIDIPYFYSWIGCTSGYDCYGCNASVIYSQEEFPVFQALVNAIHRGVTVKILTNDPTRYGESLCYGKMDLLTYLAIEGAQVRFYATTALLHAKLLSIDNGTTISISSINFSYTSFMKNREAGILLYNNTDAANFIRSVFNYDFELAVDISVPYSQYSQSDINLIRTNQTISVSIPSSITFSCQTATPAPLPQLINDATMVLITSPDFAYETMTAMVRNATKSLQISIYAITSPSLCDLLVQLKQNGIQIKVFVSNSVVGSYEKYYSHNCYSKLTQNNINVVMSHPDCLTYSHQKYWIIDDETVVVSTGNWATTDFPEPPNTFPPTGSPGYRDVNRDFTIAISSTSGSNPVLETFQTVFNEDYSQGVPYSGQASGSGSIFNHSVNIYLIMFPLFVITLFFF